MKATRPANHDNFGSRIRERVSSLWRSLGEPRVGEHQLQQIQQDLRRTFGEHVFAAPAAIARMLADEGAELQHPEIIEFDARWRESRLNKESEKFSQLETFSSGKPIDRKEAEMLIGKLESLRQTFVADSDPDALSELTTFAAAMRRAAQSLSKSLADDPFRRSEQLEIAEWLKVWIQTPNLFADWLALRKNSAEFRERFD